MIKLTFPWFKSKRSCLATSGLLEGFTDFHCHLLPGVDDGVRTMEESLEILAEYEKYGIREVWLTPHIMEDIPNTTEALKERFAELQQAYKGNLTLHLAAEYMLDSLFNERFEQNGLLAIGTGGNGLLVETSYYNLPMDFYDTLEKIRKKGFHPVLAHPERYRYMDKKDYLKLKSMGVKFQMNLFSLVGAYGEKALYKCRMLLAEEMYDLAGTDTHNLMMFSRFVAEKKLSKEECKRLITLKK